MADFVASDVALLRQAYEVRPLYYRGTLRGLLDALRIFLAVATTDMNVSWFAYRQAYFAVLSSRVLNKGCAVIVGGFDVSPEERPEGQIPQRETRQLKYILDNATAVLPVSERLATLARSWTGREDLTVVPHGFDANKLVPAPKKDGSALTVAYIRRDYLERKGLLAFVRAASRLPETAFYLVGKPLDDSIQVLRAEAPRNVYFTGWLEEDQLIARMGRSAVYVQASTHEGFGSALAMAMLCGCAPVVTNRGAIPEVVGSAGVYVEPGDPGKIAEGIKSALANPTLGQEARRRIVERFGLERRKQALLGTMDKLQIRIKRSRAPSKFAS